MTTHKTIQLLPLMLALAATVALPQQSAIAPAFEVVLRGDVIKITVWREPTITGEYIVDERGRVSIPLLGEMEVAGTRRDVVRDRIREAFTASLQDLSFQLTFLRRVAIVGAVRVPGLYAVDATLTVGDLVGLAGGALFGDQRWRLKWLRNGRVLNDDVRPAQLVAELDLQPGDQLLVPERSWLSRNIGIILGPVTSIVVALMLARR